AMPSGGRITVETSNAYLDAAYVAAHVGSQPGPHVMLAVSDTGSGIDETVQAHIFEPFFTTKAAGKGTGLGLATVHGIVKQSGGHIEVASRVGQGTTFKIFLPRVPDRRPAAATMPGLTKIPRGTETVLLAEDEEGVRSTIRIALT